MTVDAVRVEVRFNLDGQKWSHSFDVLRYATIQQLKELMLKERGAQKDLDSFELQMLGRRVPESEQLCRDHILDFAYVGPLDGPRRVKNAEVAVREEEMRLERLGVPRTKCPPPPERACAAAAPIPASEAELELVSPEQKSLPLEQGARGDTELPPGQHEVVVTIDPDMPDLSTSVLISSGDTTAVVKEALASMDPTGSTSAEDIKLAISQSPVP
eukprot:CAMPEP_0178394358 /NCGR_PEP_ID=MMETSP0689_2-20121128/12665_1 /TAXON_ID=160604 /ORGANISM="Amphidinium massartii, Strain CS-259" /LENGTH=214 /DNA_ID=CAMNT_0020014985 /DNA_START=24 /DNA_END=666 /DNA_ORIENTATION=-